MSVYTGLSCSCCAGPRNGRFPMETLCGNRNRPRWRTSQRLSDSRTTSRGSSKAESYLVISPGYSMKRCKDYIEVRLEERGFGNVTPPEDVKLPLTHRPGIQGNSPKPKKEGRSRIRDDIAADLHDQIAKLTALLEQEAAEHRNTQRRMSRELAERVTALHAMKEEEIRVLQEKHTDELRAFQREDSAKLAQESEEAAKRYEELQKELNCLKGSFNTYQESLAEEMEEVWRQREDRWKETCEEQKLMEMSKQRHSLLDMFEVEKRDIQKRALEEQALIQQSHEAHTEVRSVEQCSEVTSNIRHVWMGAVQ
ncbi:flagellum-associated coiled-coil domain-containing protein 1 [Pseudophryne corroboree]|uniref:flagellum-associated coiled-coil domain-containing protein 1 n=1 Tax=Pseudophryne corroboree TaxID=495146 RepID=UPI003081245A